jgi:hypothetical protein
MGHLHGDDADRVRGGLADRIFDCPAVDDVVGCHHNFVVSRRCAGAEHARPVVVR